MSAQLPELKSSLRPLRQFSICVGSQTILEDSLLVRQIEAQEALNSFINTRTLIVLIGNILLPLTILIIAFKYDVMELEEQKDIPLEEIDPEAEFIKNDI